VFNLWCECSHGLISHDPPALWDYDYSPCILCGCTQFRIRSLDVYRRWLASREAGEDAPDGKVP